MFKGDVKVALYALGLLVASTGNSICFKKMTNKVSASANSTQRERKRMDSERKVKRTG